MCQRDVHGALPTITVGTLFGTERGKTDHGVNPSLTPRKDPTVHPFGSKQKSCTPPLPRPPTHRQQLLPLLRAWLLRKTSRASVWRGLPQCPQKRGPEGQDKGKQKGKVGCTQTTKPAPKGRVGSNPALHSPQYGERTSQKSFSLPSSHLKMPTCLPSNKSLGNGYWPQRRFQNSIKKPLLGSRFSAPPQII